MWILGNEFLTLCKFAKVILVQKSDYDLGAVLDFFWKILLECSIFRVLYSYKISEYPRVLDFDLIGVSTTEHSTQLVETSKHSRGFNFDEYRKRSFDDFWRSENQIWFSDYLVHSCKANLLSSSLWIKSCRGRLCFSLPSFRFCSRSISRCI